MSRDIHMHSAVFIVFECAFKQVGQCARSEIQIVLAQIILSITEYQNSSFKKTQLDTAD